jgi:hypothetical protein
VTLFKAGDEVYYAGDITPGQAQRGVQLNVDGSWASRPLKFRQKLPAYYCNDDLAYEAFFDRLGIDRDGATKTRRLESPVQGLATVQ